MNKSTRERKLIGILLLVVLIAALSFMRIVRSESKSPNEIYVPETSEGGGYYTSSPAAPPKPPSFLQQYSKYFDVFWGSGRDPPVPQKQWYEVEQWEIEYCSKFGGSVSPQSSAEVISSQVSQLTATLQGSRKKQQDNTTLYEVSYYIQPISSSIPYVVEVLGKSNGTTINRTIDRGTAYPSGTADYAAFYSEENYNRARMNYGGSILLVELPDYDKANITQRNVSINASSNATTTNATANATTAQSLTCAEKNGVICPRKCPENEPVKDICPASCTGTIIDSRDGGPRPEGSCCIGSCR